MSYTLSYNGITINGDPYTITRQEGLSGLPIRISKNNLTGADGAAIYKTLYGSRTMVFEGVVKGLTEVEYFENRHALLEAFSRDGLTHELSITTWNGQTYTIDAVVTGTPQIIDAVGDIILNRFRIELEAADPFFRTGEEQEYSATVASGGVGFPIPAPIPIPLISSESGSTIEINNLGDGEVIPQFRLDGQINEAIVTNTTTGQSFSITTNIPDGRFVTLFRQSGDDFVLLDGTTTYFQYFTGNIFSIVPGTNVIELTATSSGVNALLTINYQDVRTGV